MQSKWTRKFDVSAHRRRGHRRPVPSRVCGPQSVSKGIDQVARPSHERSREPRDQNVHISDFQHECMFTCGDMIAHQTTYPSSRCACEHCAAALAAATHRAHVCAIYSKRSAQTREVYPQLIFYAIPQTNHCDDRAWREGNAEV